MHIVLDVYVRVSALHMSVCVCELKKKKMEHVSVSFFPLFFIYFILSFMLSLVTNIFNFDIIYTELNVKLFVSPLKNKQKHFAHFHMTLCVLVK